MFPFPHSETLHDLIFIWNMFLGSDSPHAKSRGEEKEKKKELKTNSSILIYFFSFGLFLKQATCRVTFNAYKKVIWMVLALQTSPKTQVEMARVGGKGNTSTSQAFARMCVLGWLCLFVAFVWVFYDDDFGSRGDEKYKVFARNSCWWILILAEGAREPMKESTYFWISIHVIITNLQQKTRTRKLI